MAAVVLAARTAANPGRVSTPDHLHRRAEAESWCRGQYVNPDGRIVTTIKLHTVHVHLYTINVDTINLSTIFKFEPYCLQYLSMGKIEMEFRK